MANTRVYNRAFSGGEMSPDMYGRIDDVKFQTGAASMRNFIATPQGPAQNRSGLSFVRAVKDSTKQTRLIPFTFNTTQTMVIELGAGYFRFHTQGSTLVAGTATAWSNATAYTVGTLASRLGVNYYCILGHTNQQPPNATYWYPLPSAAYEIPNPYAEADLFDIHYVQSADVITFTHPNYPPAELKRFGALVWVFANSVFTAPIAAPTGVTSTRYIPASASVNADTYNDMVYVVTSVASDGISKSAASASTTIANNIYVTGAYNTISWSAVTGASRYNVYKRVGGIFGYIGSTTTTSLVDDNISADMSETPPIYANYFQSSGNYPGAVSYFEQRKCFAGTINDPQKIYMTRSGTENDMSYGVPIRDDDRIEFRVAAREANTIRHIVPLTQLILLTGSAEWRVSSVNSDAITPSSISVRPQSYIGASNVQPVIINNSLVYGSARGGHVRELGYSWQSNGFVTGDLSIRAAHLFDNLNIVDMAFSKAPLPIIWFVSTSGDLLGLTYIPEQQIGAWHHHDTDGTFESVTCVAEGNEDVVYVIVKRLINGSYVRYVERMETRQVSNLNQCFFVDSGAKYDGTNTSAVTMTVSGGTTWGPADTLTITASSAKFSGTNDIGDAIIFTDSAGTQYRVLITGYTSSTVVTGRVDKTLPAALRNTATTTWNFARNSISGLTWLEGKTVSILADGAVHPQRVVTSGTVNLDVAANVVIVGLPYQSDIETLPLAMQIDGFGQGRYKNINKAWLRVFKSSGIFIGPDANNLVEAKQRSTEPYGSPPALKSDEIMVMLTPTWASSGKVFVRQSDPLPLTIVGLTLEVAIGG
jgi:hypothetical protein